VSENKGKILVVDDEMGMRLGIQRILEMHGFVVDIAENGNEGVEKGTAFEYDIYLIDLKMPDLDGTQVLREIKLVYPEAICVIVTAFASIDSAVKTTQMGAYQYIPKPFEPEDLMHVIKIGMEKRQLILDNRRMKEEREARLMEISIEQSRIKTIISALDDGIVVVNRVGEIALFNKRLLKLLQINQNIKIGDSANSALPSELTEQINKLLTTDNELRAIKQEIVIEPPAELVVMANTTVIMAENESEPLGLVSVVRDITELKKIDILKSQFINMAAHELKAPLSAVQGYLELIVDKSLGDNQELYDQYAGRSLDRTKALVSLINDLLNISRMEAGTIRREITKLKMSELIQDRLDYFESAIQEKGIQINCNFDDVCQFEADRAEMLRVIGQLLDNAIKYNKENGHININVACSGHYVETSIQDTGIGLQPEEKDRLFE